MLTASPIGSVGNNVLNPDWGSAGSTLLRVADADYSDDISAVAGLGRPSAREISNAIADAQGNDIISNRFLSAMIYAWGQFIDHDLDLTETAGTEVIASTVPTGDAWFDPLAAGTATISTTRSVSDSSTGTDASNPREQVNSITAFLDGSMIYGSSAERSAGLRSFVGGLLKTGEGGLLPDDPDSPAGNPTGTLFIAGDVRANENIELTALQTTFVREHNYWASKYAVANPTLTDQQLFEKARERVIAELQSITYNEWLPAILGNDALSQYTGYDATVNPGIANEFSTAAFRFGHSLLGDEVEFLNNEGQAIRDDVSLAAAFFNPDLVRENGIDGILKYLTSDPSSELDTQVVDSVRNLLIGGPGGFTLDLVTLNILRGRDHGLADYNSVREAYGLPRVTSFSEITSDVNLAAARETLCGSVDNIDLWVGGLAEDHAAGGSFGETLRAIIADQFERLRDGDRFWYQAQSAGSELRDVEHTSLADIIRRNTGVTNLQDNVFFFTASISGKVISSSKSGGPKATQPSLAGLTVELVDSTSLEVVATTTTDAKGNYSFDVADGVRTGIYKVRVTFGATTVASHNIAIARGGQSVVANLELSPHVKRSRSDRGPSPHSNSHAGQIADSRRHSAAGATGSHNQNRSAVMNRATRRPPRISHRQRPRRLERKPTARSSLRSPRAQRTSLSVRRSPPSPTNCS